VQFSVQLDLFADNVDNAIMTYMKPYDRHKPRM